MLTNAQILHNKLLDMEIKQAEREFQDREEMAKMQQDAWAKAHPEGHYITTETGERINLYSTMFMNVIGRRKVIGIRYVE